MTAPGAPPPPEPIRMEDAVRATTSAVVSAVMELVRALRHEIEGAQRSGEAFLGRVLGALSRSLHALAVAARAALIAALLAILGAIILSVFLVAVLNKYLGDPWGTGLTALLLLAGAAFFALRSRSALKRVAKEGERLTHPEK